MRGALIICLTACVAISPLFQQRVLEEIKVCGKQAAAPAILPG
jgi:hypothetical protein